MGDSLKFVRGIIKIALSSLVYFIGHNEILKPKYDRIRKFVSKNEGNMKIFMGVSDDLKFRNQVWSPYQDDKGNYSIILRIGIAEFIVDLSPDMRLIPLLYDNAMKLYGSKGWTILPIE